MEKQTFLDEKEVKEIKEIILKAYQQKKGIYKISGENGSGKTTLFEKMVFGNDLPFLSKEYKKISSNISYVSQEIFSYSCTVKDYIKKYNDKIKVDNIIKLMHGFGLANIHLNRNFETLSGGEKIKVSIISNLLKESNYLFLDEPTNNLDNKTIFIISHDPRLVFDNYTEIDISSKKFSRFGFIEYESEGKKTNKNNNILNYRKNFFFF